METILCKAEDNYLFYNYFFSIFHFETFSCLMKKHIWGKNHIYDQLSLYVRRIESEENYQSRTIISKIDIYKANYIGH